MKMGIFRFSFFVAFLFVISFPRVTVAEFAVTSADQSKCRQWKSPVMHSEVFEDMALDCGKHSITELRSCHCGAMGGWSKLQDCFRASRGVKVEDRRFGYECGGPAHLIGGGKPAYHAACNGTPDDPLSCNCGRHEAVTMIKSRFVKDRFDRAYQVFCSPYNNYKYDLVGCKFEKEWSKFDEYFRWSAGEGRVLTGVQSHHESKAEDRIFRFRTCQYCRRSQWTKWSSWSPCLCREKTNLRNRMRSCQQESMHDTMGPVCSCMGNGIDSRRCIGECTSETDQYGLDMVNETNEEKQGSKLRSSNNNTRAGEKKKPSRKPTLRTWEKPKRGTEIATDSNALLGVLCLVGLAGAVIAVGASFFTYRFIKRRSAASVTELQTEGTEGTEGTETLGALAEGNTLGRSTVV